MCEGQEFHHKPDYNRTTGKTLCGDCKTLLQTLYQQIKSLKRELKHAKKRASVLDLF